MLVKKVSIGIDPGSSSGGITSIIETSGGLKEVSNIRLSKSTHADIVNYFKTIMECIEPETQARIVIERVSAMPGQGVSSMFKFGKGTGFLEACCSWSLISWEEKTPRTWQKSFGMKKDKDEASNKWKGRLKQRAEMIFPNTKITLEEADSYLIAEYCRTIH